MALEQIESGIQRLYYDLGEDVRLRSHDEYNVVLQEYREVSRREGDPEMDWVDIGFFTSTSYLYASYMFYKSIVDRRKKLTEGIAVTQSRELAKPYLRMDYEKIFKSIAVIKEFKNYERERSYEINAKKGEQLAQARANRKKHKS